MLPDTPERVVRFAHVFRFRRDAQFFEFPQTQESMMYWNRKQVLVCTASHCMQKGANNVAGRLRIELKRRGLDRDVLVNTCDSIDLCDIGPNIVVYPEGLIYSGVTTNDLKDIIAHLEGGDPVERLLLSAETPSEIAREQFYTGVVGLGESVDAVTFAEHAAASGFDDAWIAEQARRGFIARKDVDGTATVTVTTKARQRYRIPAGESAE
jgi:(2Fe-2S) ferredoxin